MRTPWTSPAAHREFGREGLPGLADGTRIYASTFSRLFEFFKINTAIAYHYYCEYMNLNSWKTVTQLPPNTGMQRNVTKSATPYPSQTCHCDAYTLRTALGRIGVPDDIGGVVAFLCSEGGRWVNAQRLEASGGEFL